MAMAATSNPRVFRADGPSYEMSHHNDAWHYKVIEYVNILHGGGQVLEIRPQRVLSGDTAVSTIESRNYASRIDSGTILDLNEKETRYLHLERMLPDMDGEGIQFIVELLDQVEGDNEKSVERLKMRYWEPNTKISGWSFEGGKHPLWRTSIGTDVLVSLHLTPYLPEHPYRMEIARNGAIFMEESFDVGDIENATGTIMQRLYDWAYSVQDTIRWMGWV